MEAEPLSEVIQAVGPSILKHSATMGGAASVAGLAFGGVVGTVKQSTPVLWALASGVQVGYLGFALTATHQSSRVWLARRNGVDAENLSSSEMRLLGAGSGGTAFASSAMIFRGRSNVLPAILVGSTVGYLNQVATSYLARSTIMSRDDRTFMQKLADSKLNPLKKLTTEEYLDIMREKQIKVEAELAVIDDELVTLRAESEAHKSGKL